MNWTSNTRTEQLQRHATQVRRRSRHLWRRLALLAAVLGPGLITSNVDNDAGGISTYSLAGAQFGYALLWSLIPMTIALYVTEEMCARMAVVTGKGLSDLIREEFGFRPTFFVMVAGFLVDLGNVVAEFAGVASAVEIFGISRYIAVPMAGLVVWMLVLRGTYRQVEKIFLALCSFYLAYAFSAFLAHPDWLDAARHTVIPTIQFNTGYLLMMTALVGTTIAPWQFFYMQASFVEKRVGARQYPQARADVIAGSVSCMVIVFFIIVCTAATLYTSGHRNIADAAEAARALVPLAGRWASLLFAFGLLNASLFAASILPLSTAHVICEGLGFEAGNRSQVQGRSDFLLAVYHPHRRGRGADSDSASAAVAHSGALAGGQRRLAADRADFHDSADQPARLDGRTREQPHVQRDCLGDQRGHDRLDAGADLFRAVPSLGGHRRTVNWARRRVARPRVLC